jgi:hypothetical protein
VQCLKNRNFVLLVNHLSGYFWTITLLLRMIVPGWQGYFFSFLLFQLTPMKNQLCTLICGALVSLLSASDVSAKPAATSFVTPATPACSSAVWMPSDVLRTFSTVQVSILFPYQGQDNYWEITFVDSNYGQTSFYTDDNTAATGILGDLPEGVYNVWFHLLHGRHSYFDFYVGCDQTSTVRTYERGDVYHATIDAQCNSIVIDAYQ